ncbi:MAG TPA: glycosyltransferase family 4 protein [Candidatus Paceibacterota bacterium]|jgi:glycosyltransferase involved in cell wall biosynthesis|nr:glycosyltransferase family 4 protein [Candidatus Paceibacterota bacterium]
MFIYLSTKRFPSTTADHIYTRFLARALARELGDTFRLIISGPASEELAGIPAISVRAPQRLRSAFYFLWLPLFALRQEPGSVFFSNDLYLLSILAFWRRLPFFTYRICSDWHLLSQTWRDRYVAARSDFLITTSRRLKENLVRAASIDPSAVTVIYGGIDLEPYQNTLGMTRASLGLPEQGMLAGYVGFFKTLGKDKGLKTMIESLHHLPAGLSMVFIGGTPQELDEYRAIAEQEGVGSRCIWFGRQPFDKVAAYEKALDVLVLPYPDEPHFRDYGFPMKAYEYLASGTPIAYSRLAIIAEIFDSRATPFVPGSAASLAEAVKASMAPSAKIRAAENASAASQYSWNQKARTIISVVSDA